MTVPLYNVFGIMIPEGIYSYLFIAIVFGFLALLLLVNKKWVQKKMRPVLLAYMATYIIIYALFLYTTLLVFYIFPFSLPIIFSLISNKRLEFLDVGRSLMFGFMVLLIGYLMSLPMVGVDPTSFYFSLSFGMILFYSFVRKQDPFVREDGSYDYSAARDYLINNYDRLENQKQAERNRKNELFHRLHLSACPTCGCDDKDCYCSNCDYCGYSNVECKC
jgi:hypothetical protein